MRSSLFDHLQYGFEDSDSCTEAPLISVGEATQPIKVAEELVSPVDEMNDHGRFAKGLERLGQGKLRSRPQDKRHGGVSMDITTFSTGYPFLDIFVTMLFVFAWVLYIWIAIIVLIDIFRRRDLSGWGKAGWVIAIVVFSWLGVLIYLIINHDGMNDRRIADAKTAQGQLDDYIRSVGGGGGPASEIAKAKGLLDSGAINQAQFDAIKAKVLAS